MHIKVNERIVFGRVSFMYSIYITDVCIVTDFYSLITADKQTHLSLTIHMKLILSFNVETSDREHKNHSDLS